MNQLVARQDSDGKQTPDVNINRSRSAATRRVKGNAVSRLLPASRDHPFRRQSASKTVEETPNSAEKGGSVRPPDQFRILEACFRNPKSLEHVERGNIPEPPYGSSNSKAQKKDSNGNPQKKMPETQAPSLEKEATTMHLLSRDILFLPKKLYQCRLIVLIRKTIFLFVSAERTPVNELPFTLFEKCRDRLHQSAAGSKTVPGMYIDVPTPETLGTMIGIAIPPHLRSAPPAHEILNPFLKCFGRHIPHSFKKKQVRQPRRAPAPK